MKTRKSGSLASFFQPGLPHEEPEVVMERALWRMSGLKALAFLAMILLLLRAGFLMLVPDERLQAKAAVQFQESVTVQAPRGDILARDGTLLATTVEMPSLHADPARINGEEEGRIARELSEILDIPEERLAAKLAMDERRDVTLAVRVSPDLVREIRTVARWPLIWTRNVPTRYYPGRELAAQILGVVGRSGRGLEGLESRLDRYLRGDTYVYLQQRDRKGRAISASPGMRKLARAGDTVTLTLDPAIQRAAEEALDNLVENSEPLSASAVVIDVHTGEIMASASRPTTNPNDRNRSVAGLVNHAVQDAHEPGSVMKPFVIALALEDEIVGSSQSIDCENGVWYIGRTRIRDDHRHSWIELTEVVKYSSNIGTAKLALRLGAERVMEGLSDFGFGRATGVGIPGEVSGFLRDPESIHRVELATTAYGQGMTATSFQLASALQVLGNGGVRMQPYVISEVRDRNDQVEIRNTPQPLGRVVSEETARIVIAMMETVLEDGGTGTMARVPGYSAAGKTGTAHKVIDGRYSDTARVSSFVGLVPADEPEFGIVVMVDTPTKGSRYGGPVAGPAFSEIARRSLRYRGLPHDLEIPEEGDGAPAVVEIASEDVFGPELLWEDDTSFRLPDLSGLSMRDALVAVDGAGLQLALEGSGMVISQAPIAGRTISPGERLELRFQ